MIYGNTQRQRMFALTSLRAISDGAKGKRLEEDRRSDNCASIAPPDWTCLMEKTARVAIGCETNIETDKTIESCSSAITRPLLNHGLRRTRPLNSTGISLLTDLSTRYTRAMRFPCDITRLDRVTISRKQRAVQTHPAGTTAGGQRGRSKR